MDDSLTYREVLARGRRTFELFADRIVVRIRYPNYSAEWTVQLSNLRPTPNIVRLRELPFRLGLLLLIGPWVICALLWCINNQTPLTNALIMASVSSFVGAVCCLYCIREIDFASFVTHAGTVALDVGDAGPDRVNYRAFIDELINRISAAQRSS